MAKRLSIISGAAAALIVMSPLTFAQSKKAEAKEGSVAPTCRARHFGDMDSGERGLRHCRCRPVQRAVGRKARAAVHRRGARKNERVPAGQRTVPKPSSPDQ